MYLQIAQERPDVRYQLLAVDFMPEEILQIHMEHVGQGLASGQLKPLANVCHNFNSVATALRQMSQAQHVGKVVVTRHTEAAPYEERSTVAISGGTGMLGQLMGGWLLQMSVRVSPLCKSVPCCLSVHSICSIALKNTLIEQVIAAFSTGE